MNFKFNIEEKLKYSVNILIQSLGIVFYFLVTCILLFGSVSSMIILYKMYPELSLILLEMLAMALQVFNFVIRLLIGLLFLTGTLYYCAKIVNYFRKQKEKRVRSREKFLEDLAIKVKEKIKK